MRDVLVWLFTPRVWVYDFFDIAMILVILGYLGFASSGFTLTLGLVISLSVMVVLVFSRVMRYKLDIKDSDLW